MAPSDEILELTERFDRNRESYIMRHNSGGSS